MKRDDEKVDDYLNKVLLISNLQNKSEIIEKIDSYLFLSFMAPSLASFNAFSKARTLSCVAFNRFSNFGSSSRKSALSRTSYDEEVQ